MENLNYKNLYSKLVLLLNEYSGREVVFFCVGNHKVWFDCFAPFLAECLRKFSLNKCFVYGGINFSITPENLQKYAAFVKNKHPSACIIVVDNCLTANLAESGKIVLAKRCTNLAGLMGGYLFGDISLLLKTFPMQNSFSFLRVVENLLLPVTSAIISAINCQPQENLKICYS